MSDTIKIRVEAEKMQKFKNDMQMASTTVRTFASEISKISAQMKIATSRQDLMKQKTTALSNQLKAQENVVSQNATRYKSAREEADKLGKEYEELKNSTKATDDELSRAEKAWRTAELNAERYNQKLNRSEASLAKIQGQLRQTSLEMVKVNVEESKFGRMNSALTSIQPRLNTVASGFMKITKAVAGLSAGLVAIAVSKAFAKLETLEEVRATFQGLGKSSQQIADIMQAVQNSVTGTKLAMADMAKVSKGADASISNYSMSLEDYLGRIADISAFTGKDVTQIGTMFNKAMARNRVDARLMNQLIQAGIPIYDDLAKATGKSKTELTKMVSAGQIGFEDLYKATERYDNLATKLGMSTLSGAGTILAQTWGNVGVAFIEGAYQPLRDGLTKIVMWLKGNMETIKEWGKSFGTAIDVIVQYIKTGDSSIAVMDTRAQKMVKVMMPFVKVITSAVKGFMNLSSGAKKAFVAIAVGTGPVLKLTSKMIDLSNGVQKAITSTLLHMQAVNLDNGMVSKNTKEMILNYMTHLKDNAIKASNTALTIANTIAKSANNIATRACAYAQRLLNYAMLANPFATVTVLILAMVTALGLFASKNEDARIKVENFFNTLPQKIEAGTNLIVSYINKMADIIPDVIQGITQALPQVIESGIKVILALIMGITQSLPQILASGVKLIVTIVKGLIQAIPQLIKAVPTIVGALITAFISMGAQLLNLGKQMLQKIWQGFKGWSGTFFGNIKTMVKGIASRIGGWLGSLVDVGRNWLKGIWTGIADAGEWVWNKIKNLLSGFKDRVKKFFGIKSPSRVMRDEVGKYLALGIGVGFDRQMRTVGANLQTTLDKTMLTTDGILATASGSFVADFDYSRLASAMRGQSIYLDGRLIGRAEKKSNGNEVIV